MLIFLFEEERHGIVSVVLICAHEPWVSLLSSLVLSCKVQVQTKAAGRSLTQR